MKKPTANQLKVLATMDGRTQSGGKANCIVRKILVDAGWVFPWTNESRSCWVTPAGKSVLDKYWMAEVES